MAWTTGLRTHNVTFVTHYCGVICWCGIHKKFSLAHRALVARATPDQLSCLVGDGHSTERHLTASEFSGNTRANARVLSAATRG
jgi:hypothetical protein